ncbi:MAG TPA: hypothetical protein VFS92_07720 [Planctomycetota bacterium]|nr:hypothetical protein [Planctomycetota bacterium]
MPRHASNSERIARAAAEADAKDLEKAAAKKKAAAAAPPRARITPASRAKALPRLKVVWAVGRPGLEPVKTFPYLERTGADADAERRGDDFRVVALKVPMEP